MIISKLQGGLGNQLFQWAYSRNISIKHNIKSYLNVDFYKKQNSTTIRHFSLDKFHNINYEIYTERIQNNILRIIDDFEFKNYPFSSESDYFLDGYWQSEKYFIENRNTIKNELKCSENKKSEIFSKYPQLDSNSISIHIRITDYVNQQHNDPVQKMSYYENALKIIGNYDNIFVFSDDIEWCKNNLVFDNIIFVENQDEVNDIYTMSFCKNNIIANSSFSWWGAWLNDNKNKKVVAPKQWFGSNLNLNTSHIIPENWIKI